MARASAKTREDEETGSKSYRYLRTGTNYYSLAFTYDWIACEDERRFSPHDTFTLLDDETLTAGLVRELYGERRGLRPFREGGYDW